VRLDLTRQPFIQVEVLPPASESCHIENEFERSEVVENLVEGLEILSDVDDSGDVHFGFSIEISKSGIQELSIDLVETEENELVGRVTGEES